MKEKTGIKIISQNKKAFHDFFILDTYEAGISLKGTEVKALRTGKCNLKDSFVKIENGEAILKNMHIGAYELGNIFNQDPLRDRRLLLHKYEINKISGSTNLDGHTIMATKIYFKGSHVKLSVSIAKGKKTYDKRQDIAKKDQKREAQKDFKLSLRI